MNAKKKFNKNSIKTSYSIPLPLMEELEKQSKICGISKEKLAKRVMYKYIRYLNKKKLTSDNVISYNENKVGYKRQYFRWSEKEYVFLLECRMNMRYSISFLLALGIKKYLIKIVMAILKLNSSGHEFRNEIFKNLLEKFKNFSILWSYFKKNNKSPIRVHWKLNIF